MLRTTLLLAAALLVAGCDSETPDPISFQGVALAVRGDATLAVEGGALVVSGLTGSRSGGFSLGDRTDRVDVEISPLAIPAGGRFGVEVRDGEDALVASIYNEATAPGAFDVRFDFPSALGATVAIVRYRLGGEVVFEFQVNLVPGRTRGQRQPTSAGEGEGATGSTHVIRERGRYVVVSDSGDDNARQSTGCSGFVMTPPISSSKRRICADWVEVEPVVSAPLPEGTVSVTARGVGSFTVRSLKVR